MRRRTLEEKLEAIHQIYEWLYIYKEKGVCGLENKRICKKTSIHFKSIMKRLPKEECEKENENTCKTAPMIK